MVAFQLDIVEILFHGPHMIACCALGDVRLLASDAKIGKGWPSVE